MTFERVPPPPEVAEQPEAKRLGLIRGLRAEKADRGPYRCAECHGWIRDGETTVLVPDSVNMGTPPDIITEMCRRNAYNGTGSFWCLPCAKRLGAPHFSDPLASPWSFWAYLLRAFR
jgi:hypothetical protein